MQLAQFALKLYALKARAFERAAQDPRSAQRKVLLRYLSRNRSTEYGRLHRFDSIATENDFRRLVPLSDASSMRPYIERLARGEQNILTRDRPIFFGATSGTTSTPKLIPTTRYSERRSTHITDLWSYYIARDHPAVTRGKILAIVSPEVEGRTPSGLAYGAESGRAYRRLPFSVRHMYCLPYEVFEIPDYESRYYAILRISMGENITDVATINPNSLLLLCRKIERWQERIIADIEKGTLDPGFAIPAPIRTVIERTLRPDPSRARKLRIILQEVGRLLPRDFWPNLEVIECWKGGSVRVYLQELPLYFGDTAIRDIGCHSTEARSSIPVSDDGAGGILAIETNFYEFIPKEEIANPAKHTLLADELRQGKEYFIIVTTPSGLYRYNMDDIIRVDSFFRRTPVIEFVQKGLYATSLAGEKLYESQVNAALGAVIGRLKHPLEFFTAVAEIDGGPHYDLLVEFARELSETEKKTFLAAMDAELRAQNREYDYVRNAELLDPPALKVVRRGSYERYKTERLSQGAHDGQFKLPDLTGDRAFPGHFSIAETVRLP